MKPLAAYAAVLVVALAIVQAAPPREPPRLWLVTERAADGAILRSWTVAHVRRDGCAVELVDEGIALVGGADLVRVEPWR